MRDFLPDDVRRRAHVIGVITRVYESYGFEPLETPAAENIETLLGKYGEEGNQLIFKILKRGEHEASGQADLALRYDLTVPLARVVAHYRDRLPKLFRRYQIQPVWRADRPARGRFREFYQCDVDALGSRSPAVEAELCAAVADALAALGFSDFLIRLNHRDVLSGLLEGFGIPADLHGTALVALDKLDKVGAARVEEELAARGVPGDAAKRLLAFTASAAPIDNDARFVAARQKLADGTPARAGLENLAEIVALTRNTAAGPRLRVDYSLARGLSYYTGAIMEIAVPDLPGSLGGGGRYDNLVGMFSGQDVPACGFSLGLERILVVMAERGMFPPALDGGPADVMTAVVDPADLPHAMRLASRLRAEGLRVLVYPDAEKLGRQIKYADSVGVPFVAILGSAEIEAGTVTVKDLGAQTQRICDQTAAAAAILEGLKHRG